MKYLKLNISYSFFYLYKYTFCRKAYFRTYIITYKIFSWLNPIIVNKNTGKQKIINKKILKNNVILNKLIKQKTTIYQITLTKAVE